MVLSRMHTEVYVRMWFVSLPFFKGHKASRSHISFRYKIHYSFLLNISVCTEHHGIKTDKIMLFSLVKFLGNTSHDEDKGDPLLYYKKHTY